MDDIDPSATLGELNTSLDTIEAQLAPLLALPLNETREKLSHVERAKLDVLIAYTVNNLVWMYLKTRGIDPDTHSVKNELERLKGYYSKVRDTEEGKPQTRNRIDKDAARRFITHNISTGAPANSNAALARRQAENAIRERLEDESKATRSNRFRFVAKDAEKLDGPDGEGLNEDDAGMDVDEDEEQGNSEDEAAALLAEVDAMNDEDVEVPEPADARIDPEPEKTPSAKKETKEKQERGKKPKSTRTRVKRKRAEDMA